MRIVLGFSLVVALIAAVSCGSARGREARTPDRELPTVAVARATNQDLSHRLVLTAEFRPYQQIDVMAKIAGYIKQINVDVGDRVRQGQLLATLEIPEMADDQRRARAALDRARADVMRARDELQRARSTHEMAHLSHQRLTGVAGQRPGLVAQQEIDDARGKDLVSEAQVSAAQNALDAANEQVRMNEAELRKSQTLLDYTRVLAPFDGVVTRRFADTGSMIQAGTASQTQAMPVVQLSENRLLRLILPVPESAVPTVHIGQAVEVRVPTLHRSFPGRVARFAGQLSSTTRTMDTEVDVPNPGLILMPGMYAQVDLTLAHRARALAIPSLSIDLDPSHPGTGRVLIVTPNHLVESRAITLGIETENHVEVSSGLNEGDMVVLAGRSSLRAGQEVRPKPTEIAESQRAEAL